MDVVEEMEDDQIIKLEFEDDETEDMGSAQALVTLHDSVQNMPRKHKSALQEAVQDASPLKRPYIHNDQRTSHESLESYVDVHTHARKQSYPSRMPDGVLPNEPYFTAAQQRVMKGLLNNINNILKQSAGRRWVYYEWFYSNIDRALLLGENDFQSCLQQMFKNIKIKNLTRTQWSMIRRLMGKPRRCSPAFFQEERVSLEEKRKKIRYLHQLKGFEVTDMSQFKDLPEEIPTPMVIGTRVTAKVHPEGDGLRLFTGTVDAVDNTSNTYRINFEREGIGTHSVPDVEVASEEYEAMNLQLFIVKERPKIVGANSPPEPIIGGICGRRSREDLVTALPAQIRLAEALNNKASGTYGGFPVRFLIYLTKLSKIITLKRKYVDKLKEMNSEAERCKPFKDNFNREFQRSYAFVILELEKINHELNTTFNNLQEFMRTVAPQLGMFDQSLVIKHECDETATHLVESSHCYVESKRMKTLVTKLTSLMLQVNSFAARNSGTFEMSSLDEALRDIKSTLNVKNIPLFEDKVETSVEYIKNDLQEGVSMFSAFNTRKVKSEKRENNDGLTSAEEEEEEEHDEEELDIDKM